eukprot:Skav227996  [mRNA]  locus=scaffold390:268867:272201:- [translate_table: standard]
MTIAQPAVPAAAPVAEADGDDTMVDVETPVTTTEVSTSSGPRNTSEPVSVQWLESSYFASVPREAKTSCTQPYQLRTLLEGAELHNCRIRKGPYKRGKWVQTSEDMDSLFFKGFMSDPLVKFPKSDYMCEEICHATWPPTNMRLESLWKIDVQVFRSGGVEGKHNACASMRRVKPLPKPPKSEEKKAEEKKSNGWFSKMFNRKSKGKK